jgi:acyl carrier protein
MSPMPAIVARVIAYGPLSDTERRSAAMSIEATIAQHISDRLLYGHRHEKLTGDTDLFVNGLLDSLAVLQLIFFIEEQFGVSVEDGEMVPEDFRTISRMTAFIERKRRAIAPVA